MHGDMLITQDGVAIEFIKLDLSIHCSDLTYNGLWLTTMTFQILDFKCDPSMYSCDNGECIHKVYVCDGDKQCVDGSDETYCQCLADEFKCERSGECVNKRQFCNGVEDCKDGSDEERCCKFLIHTYYLSQWKMELFPERAANERLEPVPLFDRKRLI